MTVKKTTQDQGICAFCGSRDIEYDLDTTNGNLISYDWHCNECNASGSEWYKLEFIENISERDE